MPDKIDLTKLSIVRDQMRSHLSAKQIGKRSLIRKPTTAFSGVIAALTASPSTIVSGFVPP